MGRKGELRAGGWMLDAGDSSRFHQLHKFDPAVPVLKEEEFRIELTIPNREGIPLLGPEPSK